MRIRLATATLLFSLAAAALPALTSTSGFGIVVAVDLRAHTITFKHHLHPNTPWTESTATWDAKTEWSRAEVHDWEETPATAALAKDLEPGAQAFIAFSDELPGGKLLLLKRKTLPPDFVVK